MSLQNLFNQFMGIADGSAQNARNSTQGIGDAMNKLSSNLPGGLVGGAAAGGIMALLIGNKPARKLAGKVAGYGGAALLGGLAYKAYQNWQQGETGPAGTPTAATSGATRYADVIEPPERQQPVAELTIIKAMIAAAKSDGHIDATEQDRIFQIMERMDLPNDLKGQVFDLLRQPITVQELAASTQTMEQRSEVYLSSCMVIDLDHPSERGHLNDLAVALNLPRGLTDQLELQAQEVVAA